MDFEGSSIFISILDAKGGWAGSSRQSGRSAGPDLLCFLRAMKAYYRPEDSEIMIGCSPSTQRKRFQVMTEDCLLKYGERSPPKGKVEASFQTSYASAFFEETGDLAFTAWRSRVKDLGTLRHYIQELQSQSFASRQSPEAKKRIHLGERSVMCGWGSVRFWGWVRARG